MSKKNWREWAFLFGMFGAVQFAILTSIAMFFYGGGTIVDPNAPGYTFWANFFSDLGRTRALSGRDNTVSYIMFTITLILGSIFGIISTIAFYYFFTEVKLEKRLSIISTILLVISGILHVGIALTPWDIYYEEHVIFVEISSLTSLIGGFLYVYVIFHNKTFTNKIGYVIIVQLVLGLIWIMILILLRPDPSTTNGLILHCVNQKIGVYVGLVSNFYISYISWKKIKT
ncbi:MAG: hypothetical protein ACFFAN_09115 [Promethearchaeota archaeon]